MSDVTDAPYRGMRGAMLAFTAPFRGAWTIATRPSLWHLAIVPTLLLIVLIVAGAFAADRAYLHLVAAASHWFGSGWMATVGTFVVKLVVIAMLAVAVLVAATLVVPLLSAPVMDVVAARVDTLVGREEGLGAQIARSLRVALAGLLFVGLPQVMVWVLSLTIHVLAPLWIVLGTGLAALGLAYDALDWPLARRGLGVRARMAWMQDHAALTLGLGLAVWVLSIVPGLSIVMLPAIVVGGVASVNTVERISGRAVAPAIPAAKTSATSGS